jgi:TatD DNase family protein
MKLVDSHCHLHCLALAAGGDNLAEVLDRAEEADVNYFLCVCIAQHDFIKMRDKVRGYKNIYLSVGTHPNEIMDEEPTVEQIIHLSKEDNVVAIGETGLDYYRTQAATSWQQLRFRRHIIAARETQNPLIVHTRDARENTLTILEEENAREVGGVLHCFTENLAMAKRAIDLNFYISFSGIITFKNTQELQEVAKYVPLDRMLIETDSPYLAPVPFRGKPNEPAYVRYVAEKIAEIKKEPLEKIADCTTQNFFNLFTKASVEKEKNA